jgi:predicted permease
MQQSFESVAAFKNLEVELSGDGEPERIEGARVTASLFDALGVQPALGRAFTASEDWPGADVVLLQHGFWRRRFGGAPDVVGRTLRIDRRSYTIVGVMPESFVFPPPGLEINGRPASVLTPMAFTELERTERGMMYNNSVVGRLKPGVTLAAAREEAAALAPRIQENYPPVMREGPYTLGLSVSSLRENIVGAMERPLWILFGAVGLVLLTACANLANLTLTRAAGRAHEAAIRAALGAGRRRLIQAFVLESAILAAAGGALGLLLARWAAGVAPTLFAGALPLLHPIELNVSMFLFTGAAAALTTLLFGLAPLALAGVGRMQMALRTGAGRTIGSRGRRRLQHALAAATVAMAAVLLVGAGLLLQSFVRRVGVDPGFSPDRVLTLQVTLPNTQYAEPASVRVFARTLQEQLAATPGAMNAALATGLPFAATERRAFTPEGGAPADSPGSVAVTWTIGPYFDALGAPIVRGRAFGAEDRKDAPLVAIVSQRLARLCWPDQDPIGRRLKWGIAASRAPWMTVVGVAGDIADGPVGAPPSPHIYAPFDQIGDNELAMGVIVNSWFGRRFEMALRAEGDDPAPLTAAATTAIRRVDPSLAVARIETLGHRAARTAAGARFSTSLLGGFAAAALLLAAVGLYGVLALAVAERTRELGVRAALGADRSAIMRSVVGQGLRVAGAGAAIGLVGAGALSRLLEAALYETTPFDLRAFTAASIVLAAAAFAASYLPARRAARIDPAQALRDE